MDFKGFSKPRLFAIPIVASAVAATVIVATQSSSSAAANCDPYEGRIEESQKFTSYDLQRGGPIMANPPLREQGSEMPKVPASLSMESINGQPRQWAATGDDGAVYQYYLNKPMPAGMARAEFQQAGGIELEANPQDSQETFASYLRGRFGERVVPVEIANSEGVVVWADPESDNDLRLHHVYWDSSGYTFGLLLDQPPEDAVTSARRVACGLT